MIVNDVGAQLRKGVVEYCVLGYLEREPMYGWQLAENLIGESMIASIGTLYPVLARLREKGLVSSFEEPSERGPSRRYYRLTPAGTAQLSAFRKQWKPFAAVVATIVGEDDARD
ncbi:PadR family transcriptional regulator [Salinibacterium sp. M195]|uniref:PadR family transcriptional regulator n=1 Tax=Salinibacterium sp. M195 TaxID=2583374 RepID=UPI001C62BFD8|nr:PadR family transcriptional regulator [Salinibacterium sp. M195]QYH34765.1 PadR family transcriptional regulator [Salinibacterium sp. M195]